MSSLAPTVPLQKNTAFKGVSKLKLCIQKSCRVPLDVVKVGNAPSAVLTLPRFLQGFCDKS